MTTPSLPTLEQLRAALYGAAASPAGHAADLAALRAARAGAGPLAAELLAVEVRWLASQWDALGLPADDFAAGRREWLAARLRWLQQGPSDAAAVCDLAEVHAAALAADEPALAAACAAALADAVGRLPVDAAVDQEANERFALLATAIDDVPLAHQPLLLACMATALQKLAARTGSLACRRLGRRLRRAADDRELARRLDQRLGRRGVAALETANFALLLVVLTTLVVEETVDLPDGWLAALHWVDALACLFFIADFAFELVLHPARWSWFARNALTDLVPAIPAVLFLLPTPSAIAAADGLVAVRVLRLLRVTWAARYVQALRPIVRSARLLLFLVRGLDGLVARFAPLLNREFVFVPAAADIGRTEPQEDERDLLFGLLRREHELLALAPVDERRAAVAARGLAVRAATQAVVAGPRPRRVDAAAGRDLPIADAIAALWALRPQDLGRWLRRADVMALDRVVRVLSAWPVRWLPLVARLAVHPLPATPEERVVAAARRLAAQLDGWHDRMLFFADLHGIVTGPQILDRFASALVKATQRPAVRLILFGGVFSLFGIATFSRSLYLLGAVCLVLLLVGHWLKRLAGQASEAYRLTSEAHFLSQLEREKNRHEDEDLDFLARRVFGGAAVGAAARTQLAAQLGCARTGVPVAGDGVPEWVRHEANRAILLYLHYLDGAPLHASDVQTTEQLLASQSLENLRQAFLGLDARARKRLRDLKLDDGTILRGPFLWFRFITESLAVEAAKRIAGYNRYCIPLAELAVASPAAKAAMADWLARRRDPRGGRTLKERLPRADVAYPAAEFTALDFVGGDPERDGHLAAVFGDEVLAVLRADRRKMVREVFGTRPVHRLPKHDRSFNPLRFFRRRLSRGRVLLLPLLLAWRTLRSLGWLVGRVRQVVREVLDPELAMQRREGGEAPFAVALRKIHRMKAPGLLEAIRMRLLLDPEYAGAPAGWSAGAAFAAEPPCERDLRFLHVRERDAAQLRELAAAARAQVTALHAQQAVRPLACGDAAGEQAATMAWLCDVDHCRTLARAERWLAESTVELVRQGVGEGMAQRVWLALRGLCVRHPVDAWAHRHPRGLAAVELRALRAAYNADRGGARAVVDAWRALPPGASPDEACDATLRRAAKLGPAVRRDLMALRAIQSLAVLDIRNYRTIVFRLGEYAADGESSTVCGVLP
jgi:hypothetical protein